MLPGYDVCPQCRGSGVLFGGVGPKAIERTCPSCSGVGSVPGDAAVEAVARAISGVEITAATEVIARAALVAYAQHVKENP